MSREELIASMTEDLTPVRRVKPVEGMVLIGFAGMVALIGSIFIHNLWSGILTGDASGFYWITNGLLLLLGAAAGTALAKSALPKVGERQNAPFWSAAMLGVLPVAAIISVILSGDNHTHVGFEDPAALYCARWSLTTSGIIFVAAILWLRRGAPVSLERAGWLTGITAGALGTVAYGVTCPLDSIAHLGMWHVAPVAVAALIGRFAVPPLIRW